VESKGNSAIGEVMIAMVKNRNLDFSSRTDLVSKILEGTIPPLGAFEVAHASAIFSDLFKINIEVSGEIRKLMSGASSDETCRTSRV
jgi:hypothetical protein